MNYNAKYYPWFRANISTTLGEVGSPSSRLTNADLWLREEVAQGHTPGDVVSQGGPSALLSEKQLLWSGGPWC